MILFHKKNDYRQFFNLYISLDFIIFVNETRTTGFIPKLVARYLSRDTGKLLKLKYMKKHLIILLLMVNSSYLMSQTQHATLNLMPVPEKIEITGKKFRITNNFRIAINGNPHDRIYSAATRMLRRLDGRTGLFFPQAVVERKKNPKDAACIISVSRKGEVKLYEDESYKLIISEKQVKIEAPNDIGAIRAMETLMQLLETDSKGYYFPTLTIEDSPRFKWRGLLIDVGRHFMPVEVIKRNLDGMAAVKMNVLHLHLTEDQGFRIECKTYPKLHRLGSDGKYYTHEQIKEIVQYADERGIRVVPEFDMPGHATSWFVGYPELAAAPGPYTIERRWGIKDPAFDPTSPDVYEFLDAFYKEMAQLFPDEYIHFGGDENNGKQWNANKDIQQFMKEKNMEDLHDLHNYFCTKVLSVLKKYDKKVVGWEDIYNDELPKDIVVEAWKPYKNKNMLVKLAEEGYQCILAKGYYIDLIYPASRHYQNDPLPEDISLSPEQRDLVLGGEATMWSELVTQETIDSRIWPRTMAIAERFWSPRQINDVDDMYRRLEINSIRMEELGLTHIKNYEMMLRRLTRSRNTDALKTLVDVLEPVKVYSRHSQGVKYTSYSPYTRVVDAAKPDSRTARLFSKLVDEYLIHENEIKAEKIEMQLQEWKENHKKLKPFIDNSPVLQEIEPVSDVLSQLADKGIEAIGYIQNNSTPTDEWAETASKIIAHAKTPCQHPVSMKKIPCGQCELMVIEPIERLIKQARK